MDETIVHLLEAIRSAFIKLISKAIKVIMYTNNLKAVFMLKMYLIALELNQ